MNQLGAPCLIFLFHHGRGTGEGTKAVTKLIAYTRLIALATSEFPANLFGMRTLCRLDERITEVNS
jgi:hypothetical protein